MLQNLINSLKNEGYNIKLEDRNSSDSWMYDGNSIALKCSRGYYLVHDILHEIGHFIVAHPEQLLFPEYALSIGVVDSDSYGTVKDGLRNANGTLNLKYTMQISNGLIAIEEQEKQEFLSQLICIFLGKKFNYSANFLSEPIQNEWDEYFMYYQIKLNRQLFSGKKMFSEKFKLEVEKRFEEILPMLNRLKG